MRILIPLHQLAAWAGGLDLTRTIVDALRHSRINGDLDLVFAQSTGGQTDTPSQAELRASTEHTTQGFKTIACTADGRALMRAAIDSDAQVIFPTMVPIRGSHVRKVGYIYDFQHIDRPDLFTAEEAEGRSIVFSELAERSDAMFCTSEFVADGMVQLLDVPRHQILVLPFMAHADAAWFETDIADAQRKYRLPDRYLIICNHFWVHKDHSTALRAFATLVASGEYPDLHLVMTGDTDDFRDTGHFARLQVMMQDLGIADRCHVLGLIPKLDQIALLRGATAMLQPTRYEGSPGGMSTFQATALGVPVLLSDIAVNREAQACTIQHFRTGDADDLARLLHATLRDPPHRPLRDQLHHELRQGLSIAGDGIAHFLTQLTRS